MQASHLDVRQEGSHFGPVEASNSQIFQGNFYGLTINPTAAAQVVPGSYGGHYAHSSLRPVPNYVLRPRLHQKIKEQLHDLKDDGVEDVRILVVWGLGGAGKSQLMLNYIREYRRDYTAVFWIEAGSKESIERDYVQIYQLLYGRQTDASQEVVKVEDAVPAVKRWFHSHEGRWLVILDSADTIDNDRDKSYIDLGYFIPDTPGVHVVITSRSSIAKEITTLDAVEVAEMEPSEATELFRRYAKLTEEGPDVIKEVDGIVRELGYLALAITLAGSYVSVTARLSSDIRRYLPEYQQRRKELLRRRAKRYIHQYGESVLSTWEASFEAIENHNPAAARLLSLLAFVNFEDIFLGLFDGDGAGVLASAPTRVAEPSEAMTSSNETWQSFLFSGQQWTVYELESAFETLQSYSLIQWKADQKSYAMHKLVHAWGQDRLEADGQRQLSSLALELMADATAEDQIDPSHQLRLVPHVMASFGMFSPLHESLDEPAMGRLAMIDEMERFLFRIGRWSEAYKMRMFHFRKIEKVLGKEHPDTLGRPRLQAWEGLVPTLRTFFENFKYIEACANHVKSLITVPARGTLYTAMVRSFSETTQKRGKCIVQEAESVFTYRSCNTQDRVALHYREVFLYVIRHLRELSPGSIKIEPKPAERIIRMTKDPNKSALYRLADLAERLGFESAKISDLKAQTSNHADVRSQSRPPMPTFVVDGPGECPERRCACPYDLAYKQSREFLFLDNMHSIDRSQGSSIQPVFVRKSVYLAYFDRRVFGSRDSEPAISNPPAGEPHRSVTHPSDPLSLTYSEREINNQERENDNQEQGREPTQEYVDQGSALQEQPNAEETREGQDRRQAETSEEQEGLNSDDASEWQNYIEQLGDTSHLFNSLPRSQSVQGDEEAQSIHDIDEPVTDDGEGEWGSVAPSIISSSYYSDEEVPLEEDPLKERVSPEETPLRAIASAQIEATKKDELTQERFKFIYRDGDDWIPIEEYPFGPSLFSSVELIANKHASEGRYLFDTALWSLHPSECFEAAMAHGSHVILVFPAGKIHIDQHLAASASELGDNARPLESNTRKRAANDDISKKDHIRKKQIM